MTSVRLLLETSVKKNFLEMNEGEFKCIRPMNRKLSYLSCLCRVSIERRYGDTLATDHASGVGIEIIL